MKRQKGVIYGVGLVDVDYKTQIFDVIDGKRKLIWICPFYEKWKQMIRRCYSDKEKSKNQGYVGVTCCENWLSLQNFKNWMERQDYLFKDGTVLELDKDLLYKGNKIYSPSTCVFIHHKVNSFIFKEDFYAKDLPLGVTYDKRSGKYQVQCNDPFKRRPRHISYGRDEKLLHNLYLETKHKYACELADSEYVTDERVAKALRERYSFNNWYNEKEKQNENNA